jgi:hypothetical protein
MKMLLPPQWMVDICGLDAQLASNRIQDHDGCGPVAQNCDGQIEKYGCLIWIVLAVVICTTKLSTLLPFAMKTIRSFAGMKCRQVCMCAP